MASNEDSKSKRKDQRDTGPMRTRNLRKTKNRLMASRTVDDIKAWKSCEDEVVTDKVQ